MWTSAGERIPDTATLSHKNDETRGCVQLELDVSSHEVRVSDRTTNRSLTTLPRSAAIRARVDDASRWITPRLTGCSRRESFSIEDG
jgi:hypothetical protein